MGKERFLVVFLTIDQFSIANKMGTRACRFKVFPMMMKKKKLLLSILVAATAGITVLLLSGKGASSPARQVEILI